MPEIQAFPLAWPQGWKRTKDRQRSKFKATYDSAVNSVIRQLEMMYASRIVISSNVPVRQDGLPFSDWMRRKINDPGCAVYFSHRGKSMVLACDRWDSVIENLRAVALTINAIRGIDRWGASDMMERAFTGFQALPPPPKDLEWREVLGCPGPVDRDAIRARYRDLSMKHHPDRGGDPVKMAELNRAYQLALEDQKL